MDTYDCPPTLNDTQVLEFCKQGFLLLEGIVPAEVNRATLAYLEAHPHGEPTAILREPWFAEHVIQHPLAAGAVRSLLGPRFALPNLMSNHRVQCPAPAQAWHRDGGSQHGPRLNYLQVFYLPQACPPESGPTELLPGSHFLYSRSRHMAHYGQIRGAVYAAAPAGSILLTVYSIWHRRSASTAPGLRNLLKYNYWRTAPPARDWIIEPGFDPRTADYTLPGPAFREQFQDCYDAAQMYFWLCGQGERLPLMGGQGWPTPANFAGGPYGFPGDPTSRP